MLIGTDYEWQNILLQQCAVAVLLQVKLIGEQTSLGTLAPLLLC